MLPLLVCLLVAAGPLLRGGWDLWAQTALFLSLSAGMSLWLSGRILAGYVPLPSARVLCWAVSLALLGWLSARLSPLSAYAVVSWRVWVAALWLFIVLGAVSKDERSFIDDAIRLCGWILLLLAFYQQYQQGMERPTASLVNQNAFAAALLMILPLSVQKGDYLLTAGLLWALVLTRSVGAWLGLSAALVLMRQTGGRIGYWFGLGVSVCCGIAIYGKFQTPEVLNRWNWWVAAARMSWDSPALGFGPGTFGHVLGAFHRVGDLSSVYAHQHFLEIAAELGLVFLVLWTAGIIHCLRRGGPHKTLGALAVLIQSLWDYSLSLPSNLWLLSYLLASSSPESSRGFNVASRYKLPACVLVLGLGGGISGFLWQQWRADRLFAQAREGLAAGAPREEVQARLAESLRIHEHPEARRLTSEAELYGAGKSVSPVGRLSAAAAQLELSVQGNPYRATTWLALEKIYRRMGQAETAESKRRQGAVFCPVLR